MRDTLPEFCRRGPHEVGSGADQISGAWAWGPEMSKILGWFFLIVMMLAGGPDLRNGSGLRPHRPRVTSRCFITELLIRAAGESWRLFFVCFSVAALLPET
jgi:hypothetical protein